MVNEAIFFLQAAVALGCVLVATRLGRVWVTSLIAVMLVLMNFFVLKQIRLFDMDVTCGNVLYASVFLATDLLAEHWGRRDAYRAVRIGFAVSFFFLAMGMLILAYRPNGFDAELGAHAALATLISPQWRIVGASMVSYLIVQHLDIYLYEWWREKTHGKHLWLRNNGSTWISQFVDTVVFTTLAFSGLADFPIGQMIMFTYFAKLIVAVIDTPFIYLSKTRFLRPAGARG